MADSVEIEPTQPFGLTGFRDQRLATRPTVRSFGGERQSRTGSGFHLYGLAYRCIARRSPGGAGGSRTHKQPFLRRPDIPFSTAPAFGAGRGIRTPTPKHLFLRQACLPFHHTRTQTIKNPRWLARARRTKLNFAQAHPTPEDDRRELSNNVLMIFILYQN